jgi:hypothetical protein
MQLNLPPYSFRTKNIEGRKLIFDTFRHRWVALTPEEWVRQNFIRYLAEVKHFPVSLIAVERSLKINQRDFRADVVIFSKIGNPLVVVECKAPEVKINQQVFDQIARYNMEFQVEYLIVTNGLSHYCCRINKIEGFYAFLPEMPDYSDLL